MMAIPSMRNGGNARLYGVDAFELDQTGRRGDAVVPLGRDARDYLAGRVGPGNVITDTGSRTYGRPVVTVQAAGSDVGHDMVLSGNALPTPRYLASDPARRADYIAAQREAIEDERGAYSGEYQIPEEYRHKGADAPRHGKIEMTRQQIEEYSMLIHDPKTTPGQLEDWAKAQGHVMTNASNILSFARRNPGALISPYFQQDDAEGQAVLRDRHGIVERNMGALNEGIADVVGFPVDIANTGMKLVGLPMSERPVLGSEWVRDQMHGVGIGQYDEDFAPRSTGERYLQATARGVGQSLLPIGGTMAAGTRLAATAVPAALEGGVVRQAVRNATREAAANPRVLIAGETGANVGGNVAGQAADDYAPGNPYARVGAQIVGSLAGGLTAGSLARSRHVVTPAKAETVPKHISEPTAWDEFPDAPIDHPAVMAMKNESAEAEPSISSPRQRDVIDVTGRRTRPVADGMTEAQMSAAALLVAEMAAKGNITGNGPADDGAKAMLRADGWQPYSIKIGDKYYSYSRMDPFSTTLGVAADMVELQEHMTEKQRDNVATLLTASVMQNLSSKTWLSGISSLVEAVNDPDRYSAAWLKRLAASAAVPAGVAQVARTMDPAAREAESILDAVKARVPGLSKSLNPKRDAWGRPVIGEGDAGPDIVSPIWQSTRKNDPVTNALLDAGISINPPQREVGGVRLDGKQWGQYRERAGQIGYDLVSELVSSPDWKSMTAEERKDAVSDIMRQARKEARGELADETHR